MAFIQVPVLSFQKKAINNNLLGKTLTRVPVLSFQKKVINNTFSCIAYNILPVLSFQKKVINNIYLWRTSVRCPVLSFQKKVINNLFRVKFHNKVLYNRKVSEIFHNFTVSLLPNTLLFMFHSHYFIKYSKN